MSADTRDMLAVHRAFRREFADLVDLVFAVPDGDLARANIVGEHVLALTNMTHSHHASEDEVLWTILRERAPEMSSVAAAMEGQHLLIDGLITNTRLATQRWMMSASSSDASQVTWCMEQMSANVDKHLAQEEELVLPVAASRLSQEEWDTIGEHSRAGLTTEQLGVTLGVIEDAATDEEWALISSELDPSVRQKWDEVGRPAYREYRTRLAGR